MSKEIILVGGGGHCRSVIDILEEEGSYSIAGIVDVAENIGKKIFDYPIIATDSDIEDLLNHYKNFLITVGHIKTNELRKRLFDDIKIKKGVFPVVISPHAHVSKHAVIGEGTVVFHHAVVNASVVIGKNNIINTASVIEHDAVIGDHCHVAPGAVVNGACNIGSNTFIGSNVVVVQGTNIGADSLIAAGTVIKNEVDPRSFMAGNPGIKKREL